MISKWSKNKNWTTPSDVAWPVNHYFFFYIYFKLFLTQVVQNVSINCYVCVLKIIRVPYKNVNMYSNNKFNVCLFAGDRMLCISSKKFYMTYSFMVAVTLISSAMSMVLWIRLQRKSYKVWIVKIRDRQ